MSWKPHNHVVGDREPLDLDVFDKVVATADLQGVPAGTRGKVMMRNGFNWLRYRVHFDNGVELTALDGRHIAPAKKRR
jgi:hypothetical protein